MGDENREEYTAKSIKVLKGLEGVRRRPAMYLGTTGPEGLHRLIFELMDNAVDEAMAGHCNMINITIYEDGSCEVEDNGRGIPVDMHETGKTAAEVVMTTLHAGGKFDHSVYKVSGGLHGVGASVVNALSERLDMWIKRDGKLWFQRYSRGKPKTPFQLRKDNVEGTGTKIRFWPDSEIFEDTRFSFEEIEKRAKELCYLNPNLKITLKDRRTSKKASFRFEGGIKSFVKDIASDIKKLYREPIYISGQRGLTQVEVAIQHTAGYKENILSFANNIKTSDGGTHTIGFKTALTRAVNQFSEKVLKKRVNFDGDDVREGIFAVISVKVPEPQFEGQTKAKLGNPDVKGIVDNIVYEEIINFFSANPQIAEAVVKKANETRQAKEAARKAKEMVRRRIAEADILPGKLADCQSNDPERREIFIVEGESAGGSVKQAREKLYQAILPIRGKILNVEKASYEKIMSSDEIKTIVAALGCGTGRNFDLEKLRYKRIIILSDADIDGSHIRTLFLTFFWRQMRPLVEEGFLYIAEPPLYKVRKKDEDIYLKDDRALREFLIKEGSKELKINHDALKNVKSLDELGKREFNGRKIGSLEELLELCQEVARSKVVIQRFKGLGEMNPKQLWDTTLNPKTRTLLKVTVRDAKIADRIFSTLMGSKVEPRRKFIEEHALDVKRLDI